MKRRILSIITALALCLSLCPTWAFATEADPSLCKHHPEHTEDCGYAAPTEGQPCGHEHTEDCYITDEAGGEVLDCHHSHDSECGYVQADPGTSCGYVCNLCPIEDLIAALPEQVTEDNAADVRGQLDHILALFGELNEDEQEEINLSRCYALQAALDEANAPMTANGSTEQQDTDEASVEMNGTTTYYATLEEAFTAVNGQTATITMLTNAECSKETGSNSSPLVISGGKVTLNLNEKTLSGKGSGYHGIIDVTGGSLLVQGEEGKVNVTMTGLSCRGSGKLTVEGITLELVGDNIGVANAGVENSGGTVVLNGTQITGAAADGQIYHYSGTTTINNVTATGTTEEYPKSVWYDSEGTLKINGGTFDKIVVNNYDNAPTIAGLLGEGCAYKKQGGTWATDDELAGLEISNVTVAKIPLTIHPQGDTSWYYSTQQTHTLAMNAAPVDSGNSVSYVWKSGEETLDCTSDAYTVPTGMPVGSYTYTCEATCDGYTLSHMFTFKIEKSGTDLTSDGKVKTYKDGAECSDFTAGDTIKVVATPTPTGAAPQKAAARLRADPTEGQMVVFVNNTQVSEPAGAGEDGSYTMTVSATDVLLAAGGPGTGITLTAKFVENDNMADGTGTATVNITAAAKAELDGKVIGYYGESNLDKAFANDGATVTLLANVERTNTLTIKVNCTLDLGGHNITFTGTENVWVQGLVTAMTIRGEGEIISEQGHALVVTGSVTLEGGTFTSNGENCAGVYVNSAGASLSVTGEYVTIRNTGGGYGLAVNYAQSVQLSAGTYKGEKAVSIVSGTTTLGDLLDGGCAYHSGDTPIALEAGGKELTGTVTVQECQHTGVEVKDLGSGKHGLDCPYCGYHSEHTTTLTATVSGNTVTFRGGCESCDYRAETLATAAFTIPKLTYGQTDQTVSCTWEHPDGYALMVQIDSGEELQLESSDTQVSLPLKQLFGSQEINAGNYQLHVYCRSYADVTSNVCSLPVTVDPAPLPEVTLSAESATYSGTEQKPALSVQQGETALTEGTDYEVSYTRDGVVTNDFTSAGTVNITVTGKENYTGSVEKTYTIGKATPTIAWANNVVTLTYTGQPADIKPVVTLVNGETFSGTITYHHTNTDSSESGESRAGLPTNAGIYVVGARIPEQDNYTAATTASLMLMINKADQTVPAAPTADEENIKDTSITLDTIENAEYKRDDGEWQDSPVFTDLSPNTPYTFYARLKEDANHNASPDSAAASITTKKTMLNTATVTVSGSYTYTGAAIVPEAGNVTVELNGTTINSNQYTISATNNTNAGTATVTITATETGDYSSSVSSTFTISPATPTITWSSTTQELAYTGSAATITAPTVTLVGSDTFSGTITYSQAAQGGTEFKDGLPTNAGTYTIKASIAAQGNYTAADSTNTLTLTIKPTPVTLTFADQTIAYGDTPTGATADPASAKIEYSYTTGEGGEPISGWPTNAGTYTVTAKVEATGNYGEASETATLTINPKAVSNPTIELSPSSFDYDGTAKKPAVTVKDGTTVIPASEYTVAYSNNINAGDATVTITNVAGNYTVSGTKTFTITKANQAPLTITGAPSSVTYGDTFQLGVSGGSGTGALSWAASGATVDNAGNVTITRAGTVIITAAKAGDSNYYGTEGRITLNVSKKALTVTGATAQDRQYDGTSTVKITGVTLDGIVNGDTVSVSTADLTGTLNGSNVGSYTAVTLPALTLTGEKADNYTLTQPAGAVSTSVTISKADAPTAKGGAMTVSNDLERTYSYSLDQLLPALTGGQTFGTVTYSLGTVSLLGDYYTANAAVTGDKLSLPINEVVTNDEKVIGTVEITISSTNFKDMKATITISSVEKIVPEGTPTASPNTITYGQSISAVTLSGQMSDGTDRVDGRFTWDNPNATPDAGTYQAAWTFIPTDTGRYTTTTGTVIITVRKATPSLTLTPSPATLPNGGTVTLTLSGLPSGGSATVTCSDANITVTKGSGSTWTADLPAGGASYTFTASYSGDGNHNGATASCTVSVEKITPTLSLTANPVSLRGGGTVTLTLSGLPTGGTATVTCSGGITVTAGAGSTWTATLPNSTATYTFTASYAGNTSYNAASASCTVETTEVTVLPNPPEAEDGKQYQVIMEDGISEVPAGLQSIETLNTPEKLETAMKTAITQANSGVPQANTAVYDVELQISADGGATWMKATAANFPANGLTVTLPYPAGTNSSYTFTVVHMFTTSDFDKTPGDTETPRVTNTASGLQFTVTGLSPISVGWVQPKTPVTPPTPSGGGGGGGSSVSTYAVTIEKSEHGKVTSNRTNASSGSTVTLTVTPDSGYVLDTLTVTDSRGSEIRLTAQGSGKYTFTMPSRAVTVKATFAPLPEDTEKPCDGGADCPSHGFTDLGTVGTWYHEAVDYVLRNNLMGGYGNGLFGPNDTLTRAQFAQILYNKEGRPAVTGSSSFSDVAPGAWCAPAITWAAERGIVGGYGNGMFGPNDNITREQLAVMLWRYAGSPAATDKELHFNDADKASGYALDALRWAVENGIINGKGWGILDPKGLAIRAQTAQMLKNFLKDE